MEYELDRHNLHLIVHHIIGCPKRRRNVLMGTIHDRLKEVIYEVANEHQWSVIEAEIQPDHVQLFIGLHPHTLPTALAILVRTPA